MDRRKFLTPYVRTNKRGKIVSGSLVLLKNRPKTPGFKEVLDPGVDLCRCEGTSCGAPFWVNEYVLTDQGFFASGETLIPPVANPCWKGMDANCNVYFLNFMDAFNFGDLFAQDIRKTLHISKTSPTGALLWQTMFYITTSGGEPIADSVIGMVTDKQGNCYVAYTDGVVKFDTTGALVWDVSYDRTSIPDQDFFNGIGDINITNDGVPVITAYITDGETGNTSKTFVGVIDPATGAFTAKKAFRVPLTNSDYLNNIGPYVIGVDPLGFIYAECIVSQPEYCTAFIKMDINLNVIWTKVTDRFLSTWTGDMDCTDIKSDAQGNIYLDAYQAEIYKIDQDGNTLWTTFPLFEGNSISIQCHPVDSNGNMRLIRLSIDVITLDTNGNLKWADTLNNTGSAIGTGSNWKGQEIINNALLLQGSLSYTSEAGLRLSSWYSKYPTDVALSTTAAGPYAFIDTTSLVSMNNTSNIVLSPIVLDVFDNPTINSANYVAVVNNTKTLVNNITNYTTV